MKKLTLTLIISLISIGLWSQTDKSQKINIPETKKETELNIKFQLNDTLKIKDLSKNNLSADLNLNIPKAIEIKNDNESESQLKDTMPWIVALLVGLLSVIANVWAARSLKKSNEENLKEQNKNSKEILISELKANLSTQNRQNWIDNLRQCLSDFISQSAMINVEMSKDKPITANVEKYFEKMNFNKAKIAMLLNPEREEQKNVLDFVFEMVSISFKAKEDYDASEFKDIEDKILKASRNLFGIHWNKIKTDIKGD